MEFQREDAPWHVAAAEEQSMSSAFTAEDVVGSSAAAVRTRTTRTGSYLRNWVDAGKVALVWAATAALLGIAVLCYQGQAAIRQTTAALQSVQTLAVTATGDAKQLNATLGSIETQVNVVGAQINQTIQAVNRPCGTGAPCGTLADVAKTLGTIRGTAGQVEIAANHENRRLTTLDAQEDRISKGIYTGLDNLNADLIALKPVEANAAASVKQVGDLAGDPKIKESVANIATTTSNVADMSDEVRQEVHNMLHPKLAKKIWNLVTGVGLDLGKLFY